MNGYAIACYMSNPKINYTMENQIKNEETAQAAQSAVSNHQEIIDKLHAKIADDEKKDVMVTEESDAEPIKAEVQDVFPEVAEAVAEEDTEAVDDETEMKEVNDTSGMSEPEATETAQEEPAEETPDAETEPAEEEQPVLSADNEIPVMTENEDLPEQDPVDNLVAVLRSKEDWEQIMCGVDLMIKNLFLKPCDGKLILDQEETRTYANFLILKTYISEALKK